MSLELQIPSTDLKDAFLSAVEDYLRLGAIKESERYKKARDDFDSYLRRISDMAAGKDLQPGWVPQSYYWLVQDGRNIVAITRLRHDLTPDLEIEGGHIGYDVPPSQRRKGYATEALRQTLPLAKELGLNRVLLTVDDSNTGSIRTIEKCGGQIQDKVVHPSTGILKRRYWIEL